MCAFVRETHVFIMQKLEEYSTKLEAVRLARFDDTCPNYGIDLPLAAVTPSTSKFVCVFIGGSGGPVVKALDSRPEGCEVEPISGSHQWQNIFQFMVGT